MLENTSPHEGHNTENRNLVPSGRIQTIPLKEDLDNPNFFQEAILINGVITELRGKNQYTMHLGENVIVHHKQWTIVGFKTNDKGWIGVELENNEGWTQVESLSSLVARRSRPDSIRATMQAAIAYALNDKDYNPNDEPPHTNITNNATGNHYR